MQFLVRLRFVVAEYSRLFYIVSNGVSLFVVNRFVLCKFNFDGGLYRVLLVLLVGRIRSVLILIWTW